MKSAYLMAVLVCLLVSTATGRLCSQEGHGSAPKARMPQVICRPCGEMPPPKGYTCSGSVMIAGSVATKDISRVAAACQKSVPAGIAKGKSQRVGKAPAPKKKARAEETNCRKKKAPEHTQGSAPGD